MRRPSPAPRRRGKLRVSLCALVTLGVSAGLVAGSWVPQAAAQEGPGGMRLTLGVDHRLEADTNQRLQLDSPGASFTASSRLSFGLLSQTRTQSLRLNTGLTLRAFRIPGESRRFDHSDPSLSFAYSRTALRSDFSLSGSYQATDLRFTRAIDEIIGILDPVDPVDPVDPLPDPDAPPPEDPVDPVPPDLDDLPEDDELEDVDLLDGRGTRDQIRLESRLRLGLGGPVTTTLGTSYRETRYGGGANPGLNDRRWLTFNATSELRLTPVTLGTVGLVLERYERDDTSEYRRDTRRLSFGIRHQVSQVLTVDASLGYSWIDTEESGISRERRGLDAGFGFSLALKRGSLRFNSAVQTTDAGRRSTLSLSRSLPMRNGSLSFSASSRRTEEGTRTSFTVGRSMDLRRGPLSASIGLSRSPEGSWGSIGQISYSEELKRGSWRVSLVQGFSLDEDDRETRRTLARAGYTHFINNTSRINLDAAYTSNRTTEYARLSATYSRDVTRDWSLNVGYRYDARERSGGRADSHALFLNLGRSFNLGL